ncbi:M48 family metallopeptidase [Novipirellula artificiosorum]|uniref:Peptidase M48 domain-containing protein n=1 Tax=Novipirellula artificiosorum TaxID=2528016 RepID=A0A5C6DD37_9BACT|nr:M48 family metallopeptidase [Novipirellula artificiosorum]TWU35153.1 hypothetical protein Poly41_43020 [Novipirellula artificiosorum]
MSTHFFERQAKARKNTVWLIAMFIIATISIVAATFFAVTFLANLLGSAKQSRELVGIAVQQGQALKLGSSAAVFAALLILSGTLYKVLALRHGGGMSVAESVGGKRAFPSTGDLAERRLLNIVEEMAIASGTPVPPVFVLDEPGINAFAAGYSSSDAVIGVTRGAIEHLNREQLQGVIAHEFSHILNGDMRMSIRLIGILHGILLLALIGKLLFRVFAYGGGGSRSSRGRGGAPIYLLGFAFALIIIGSLGSLLGGLIKAAVSRQREYLADASAVQFTRNPGGIAGALKKIGGLHSHGKLKHPNATVASHMYFAQGVFEGLTGLMATHPPLPKRIMAIDPGWDGVFPSISRAVGDVSRSDVSAGAAGFAGDARVDSRPTDDAPLHVVNHAADQIGTPEMFHRRYAAGLLDELDPKLLEAARDPYAARAVVFALLLDREPTIRSQQMATLNQKIEPSLVQLTQRLSQLTDRLPDKAYLPVIDVTLPSLAAMSKPQYVAFMQSFDALARADSKISVFEWTLAQVLRRNLRPHFGPVQSPVVYYYGLQRLTPEVSVLLSTLARVGHESTQDVQMAFAAGARRVGLSMDLLPESECTLKTLDDALKVFPRVTERLRGKVVDGCAATVCADGKVRIREAELLRGIADLLDCPVPPLIERDLPSR